MILIGELQIPAVRHAARDPRDLEPERRELSREQEGRRLPVDRRRCRDEHLANRHLRIAQARDQRLDRQVLRADPLERREQAAEHEVATAHRAAPLDRQEILNARDHAEQAALSPRVAADRADRGAPALGLGDVAAARARPQMIAEARELEPERSRCLLVAGDEMKREPLGSLLPHAGKAREKLNDTR